MTKTSTSEFRASRFQRRPPAGKLCCFPRAAEGIRFPTCSAVPLTVVAQPVVKQEGVLA